MQQVLFDVREYIKFELPDYRKVYSVYAYDHELYVKKYKQLKQLAQDEGKPDIYWSVNPYDIINECILRNKDGTRQSYHSLYQDEKHIFRYKALNKLYELLAIEVLKGQQLIPFDNCILDFNKIKVVSEVYTDSPYEYKGKMFKGQKFIIVTAQLEGSEMLSVYRRVKIHLNLLCELRNGATIKQAVYKTRRKYGKWLKK